MFKILAEIDTSKETELRTEFLYFLLDKLGEYEQVTCPDCNQAFFIDLLPDDETTTCVCGCEFFCEDVEDDELLPPRCGDDDDEYEYEDVYGEEEEEVCPICGEDCDICEDEYEEDDEYEDEDAYIKCKCDFVAE